MPDEPRTWLDAVALDPAVTALRPDYTALLIVADGLRPGPSDDASDAVLRDAEARAVVELGGRAPEDLEPIAEWRAAYRAFGAKPQRTRSSVEALLRRVGVSGPPIPGNEHATEDGRDDGR